MIFARKRISSLIVTALFIIGLTSTAAASDNAITYQTPPDEIADIVTAPWTPRVSVSPNHVDMLMMQYPGLPSIEQVSQPELRVAGLRINPRTNGPSRGWYFTDLHLRTVDDRTEHEINGLPQKRHITDITWSPNGDYIAFANTVEDHVQLWLIDVDECAARQLSTRALNAAYGDPFEWLPDNKTIVAKTVLDDRTTPPEPPYVPAGPNIQENLGKIAPARTYQDLLANPYDEEVFEYYTTSQIVLIDVEGNETVIGRAGIIPEADVSPDGNYVLVTTVHRPFSYTVPVYRFPRVIEVWNHDGEVVYEVADLGLAEDVPIAFGSVPTGPRSVNWRQDADATLYWTEALDGGDAGAEAEERDRILMLAAPFETDPTPLLTMDVRFSGIQWGHDNLAIASGWWWSNRKTKAWIIQPGNPDTEPVLWQDRSWEDRYNDPGSPMMHRDQNGAYVMITANDGNTIFLTAAGASPEGNRPFVDALDIESMETTRLFRSEAPYYEDPVSFLDVEKRLLLTRRESVDDPPNYYKRDLKHNDIKQLTFFPHPTPQLKDVKKELVKYERDDGVQLTGKLYTPPGYNPEEDGPLPMLMWAYPREYKDANSAGQVTDSPYRFVRVSWSSPLIWLAAGYAVLDDAAMPIIGEGDEEPNDSFIEQLVASAKAGIDVAAEKGVADPDRVCIGGHSYGAFMTANLLAHSDLFAAGIARSGAYNRTLTPFGFQSEERSLWEAPEIYFAMSPFMHAEKINEPLLLIHGEADNNSGTYPLQSERFFGALKGHGATVRLVMLPFESHGYRAQESVLHQLWEMHRWMETYVKSAPQAEPGSVKTMSTEG